MFHISGFPISRSNKWLFYFMVMSVHLFGQDELRFTYLAPEDGLSHSLVHCVFQDHQGFMWLGTRDGLNMYDGYTFKVYRHDIYDSTSLSDNWVIDVVEDKSNRLWVATINGGFNQFDRATGRFRRHNNFMVLTDDSLYYNPLHYIRRLFPDSEGKLWILTYASGVTRYDPVENRFRHYRSSLPADAGGISHYAVTSIYEDRSNVIWLATNRGLNRYNPSNDTFTHFYHDPDDSNSIGNDHINAVYQDSSGIHWIATEGGGLNRYDVSKNYFRSYRHDADDRSTIGSDKVNRICEDPQSAGQRLWVSTGLSGLSLLDKSSASFTRIRHDAEGLNDGGVDLTRLMVDTHRRLWMTGRDGKLFSLETDKKFTGQKSMPAGIETYPAVEVNLSGAGAIFADEITTIYEDRNGSIWLGTGASGVANYDPSRYKFTDYTVRLNDQAGYSAEVRSILIPTQTASEIILIGTMSDGLFVYDRQSSRCRQFKHDPSQSNSLPSDYIGAIVEDGPGRIWIGTNKGLVCADPGAELQLDFDNSTRFVGEDSRLSDQRIISMLIDREGFLWIGTLNGLNRYDPQTGEVRQHLFHRTYTRGTPANSIYSLLEDRHGFLWVGTAKGLVRLDRESDPLESYADYKYIQHEPQDPRGSLSNDWIFAMVEDSSPGGDSAEAKQILWIGTSGGGLNKMTLPSGYSEDRQAEIEYLHFTDKEGLPGNTISGILPDEQGNLWISSKGGGLFRFRQSADRKCDVVCFDRNDGVQGEAFYLGSYFKSNSGEMFFGGRGGFNSFDPDSLSGNPTVPEVRLTGFKVFDRPVFSGSGETSRITLNHDQNFFSFEFAALSFTQANKNNYKYKLDGLDGDWINSGTRRYANYTNISPGEYVFRVKAANNDGLWTPEGLSIQLSINPPFWSTWWFRALMVVGTLCLLIIVYKQRIGKITRQKIELERMVRVRTSELEIKNATIEQQAGKLLEIDRAKNRLFANISHEFRTPLTLVAGPLEELISESQSIEKKRIFRVMQQHTGRLLRLINQLLDLARLETGDMRVNLSAGDLIGMAKHIVLSFQPLADRKNIQLRFDADGGHLYCRFDGDKIEKILYNLLSNAFKFTPEGGRISVDCDISISEVGEGGASTADDFVTIAVRDSGGGIAEADREHVFDRFYQACRMSETNSHAPGREGSGIGLSLTKELVELLGGDIQVESTPGLGSEFTVKLPVEELLDESASKEAGCSGKPGVVFCMEEAVPRNAKHLHGVSIAGESPPVVLVVEDNRELRYFIEQSLSPEYRVIKAIDGAQGVKAARRALPDIVVSDVMMPKIDGYELCDILKTSEKTSHIPVVLLTARASAASKLEGLANGADDYLVKPFEVAELRMRVRNLVNQRRHLRTLFRQKMVLAPVDIEITPFDQVFLEKVCKLIEQGMEDPDFGPDGLRRQLGMSRAQFYRRIHALTGQSPSAFIRSMRLERARDLLKKCAGNVSEVAFSVGFNSLSYFSKCFRQKFEVLPSELEKQSDPV